MSFKVVLPLAIFASVSAAATAAPVTPINSELRASLAEADLEWAAPTKSALKFAPTAYKDLATGKAIAGTAMMTLPDGKKIQASQFFDQVNKIDAFLAKQGIDSKTDLEDLGVVERAPTTEKLKSAQTSSLLSGLKLFDSFKDLFNATPAATGATIQTPVGPCVQGSKAKDSREWNHDSGNSKFAMNFKVSARAEGDCTKLVAATEQRFDAKAFSYNINIARASLTNEMTHDNKYKVDTDVVMVGIKLYDNDLSGSGNTDKKGEFAPKPVVYSNSITIPVLGGVFKVKGSFKTRGSVKVAHAYANYGSPGWALVRPEASVDLTAEGSVDAHVIEAGVGSNLVLIKGSIESSSSPTVRMGTAGKLHLSGNLSAHAKLEYLKGRIYAFVKYWGIKKSFPFVGKKRAETEVTSWSGFKNEMTLFKAVMKKDYR